MGKELVESKTEVVKGTSPAELIRVAVAGGADLEKLQGLLDLQIKYEANEAKKAYVVAMTAFKADPPEIVKDRKVAFKEVKYSHASLANVTAKINVALSEHGLSAAWQTRQNGAVTVICKITHVMGHSEETSLTAGADNTGSKNTIQAIGSTITYLQRYSLLSLTGLAAADQDDDGRGSEGAVELIDEQQLGTIRDYIDNNEGFKARLLKYLKIGSIEEMPRKDYTKAIVALKGAK